MKRKLIVSLGIIVLLVVAALSIRKIELGTEPKLTYGIYESEEVVKADANWIKKKESLLGKTSEYAYRIDPDVFEITGTGESIELNEMLSGVSFSNVTYVKVDFEVLRKEHVDLFQSVGIEDDANVYKIYFQEPFDYNRRYYISYMIIVVDNRTFIYNSVADYIERITLVK